MIHYARLSFSLCHCTRKELDFKFTFSSILFLFSHILKIKILKIINRFAVNLYYYYCNNVVYNNIKIYLSIYYIFYIFIKK